MRFLFLPMVVVCGALACLSPARAQSDGAAGPRGNAAEARWLEAGRATRAGILADWQKLAPTTRPPFPLFRDRALKNASVTVVPPVVTRR